MTWDRRRLAAILAALALTLGAAACGDDDNGDDGDTTSVPEVTIPEDVTTAPEETTTSESQTTEDAEVPTTTINPDEEDTETNDKAPAPGSPEEAFEKDCAANPGKCG